MLPEYGIRVGPMGPTLIRAVTHLDVDTSAVDEAIAAARELAAR
jgi:threonine aldolase